jgi:hypothetical protein
MTINLNNKKNTPEYDKQLEITRVGLINAAFNLFQLGKNLAIKGKLNEWYNSQSPDSEVILDEEMLLDSGDELVTRIIKLSLEMNELMLDVMGQIESSD